MKAILSLYINMSWVCNLPSQLHMSENKLNSSHISLYTYNISVLKKYLMCSLKDEAMLKLGKRNWTQIIYPPTWASTNHGRHLSERVRLTEFLMDFIHCTTPTNVTTMSRSPLVETENKQYISRIHLYNVNQAKEKKGNLRIYLPVY